MRRERFCDEKVYYYFRQHYYSAKQKHPWVHCCENEIVAEQNSKVFRSVQAVLEKFENAVFLGIPFTLIVTKTKLFTGEIWQRWLSVDVNIVKKTFSKTTTWQLSCDFLDRGFLKHNFKMTYDCCFFKFLREKVLIRFQSDTSVFKFIRDPRAFKDAQIQFKSNSETQAAFW